MVPVNGSGEPSISPTSPSQRHKGHFARDVALHPIRGSAPDQGQCTRSEEVQCLQIGCSAPINKNKRGIDRSIDATTTSKQHEGRRRVELNREISRRANPLLFGGCRATADPGCGARRRRQGLAGLRDRSLRAFRLACGDLAGGPPPTGAPRSPAQQPAQQRGRKPPACAPAKAPPRGAQPRHTLTAWRPRS